MDSVAELETARQALRRQAWGHAYARLSEPSLNAVLTPEDLVGLFTAAYLTGRDAESFDALERAHRQYLRRGNSAQAALCAFWLAMGLFLRDQRARGGGWMARAQRLISEQHLECAARGWLLTAEGRRSVETGEYVSGYDTFEQALDIGRRVGDAGLIAFARHGQGRALLRMGEVDAGLALLDEVMVSVTTGELAPLPTGMIYCSVIEACQEIFDLHRAGEWTAALSGWCAAQQDLVPFRGQCLVHRSQVLQARGAWSDAMREIRLARQRLSDPPGQAPLGMALYQQAELHRLRGEFDEAEELYGQTDLRGHSTQPGFALLRLAQGHTTTAATAIRQAVDEETNEANRAGLLSAQVEIMLANRDTAAARKAADELIRTTTTVGARPLRATAMHARGSVLLATHEPRAAVAALREACTLWSELDVPYEAARSRVLLGSARLLLGDEDTARLELDAAESVFRALGATPDLRQPSRAPGAASAGELTERELQVIALVSAGKSNRDIATQLVLSEHTVRRHLQNVFAKLGVSSRAAATRYAVQHNLV
ncbi:LuxR family transcriptional regulator [Halopolyspora algeriensis]|uniref:LuxR family transcriptional regulator n=1 Tax=Halopolyspora algeriensis TaxID=1500506 RepID=A0A368VJP5_9ACTN|nr:LuxR family transcriptional regulator [Halopolyspora algeriensis]RCW40732.1 LuxR family transcriptional regulator [Halopolyspora algeriensis]TQM53349.1 LuxR family transcriptional regulator [Halopolyspora algeriensis]